MKKLLKVINISKISIADAYKVGRLHIEGIPTGFISSLGRKFVSILYTAISKDENSFCLTLEKDGQIIGFVAFTGNLGKLYLEVLKCCGIKFIFSIGFQILRPSVCKSVIQNIFYPCKASKNGLPKAELLSIVVDYNHRNKGLANRLCKAGLEQCRKQGIEKVKVLVASHNEPANRLYKKCGFEFNTTIESHGIPSNIYLADLQKDENI